MNTNGIEEISSLDEQATIDALCDAIEVCDELQASGIDTSSHQLRH